LPKRERNKKSKDYCLSFSPDTNAKCENTNTKLPRLVMALTIACKVSYLFKPLSLAKFKIKKLGIEHRANTLALDTA
jgi:hypothetical protein